MSRPVRVTLDTTAIVAYAHGSTHVGEILAEVVDEDCRYLIPHICLAEAAAQVAEEQWPLLQILLTRHHCLQPAALHQWRDLAFGIRVLGSVGRAEAMLAAVRWESYLLTGEPDAYGDDRDLVIDIS